MLDRLYRASEHLCMMLIEINMDWVYKMRVRPNIAKTYFEKKFVLDSTACMLGRGVSILGLVLYI